MIAFPLELAPTDLAVADLASWAMAVTFGAYIVGVFAIGLLSHRVAESKGGGFLASYFLGNRGLGSWTLAFSFAATTISGGTFLGLPSVIYQNGWSAGLWICSYMVVPLVTMLLYAKRINAMGREFGSITLPDLLRDRFGSPTVGLNATLAIIFFLTVNLIGQFKGGALILQQALSPTLPADWATPSDPADPSSADAYLLGLLLFTLTVVAYTAYGGFWAVTLADLLEGGVMLAGVLILLPLTLSAVGGFAAATDTLQQTDPALVTLPGPTSTAGLPFLPLGLAVSFWLYWPLVSAGQPSGMVRMMSFRDTGALRRAIVVVTVYMALIYAPLILIFTCARALYPTEYLGKASDNIMPVMISTVAPPWLAGLLLAAPYAAIMSTVAAFLLIISSGIVRDVCQRTLHIELSESTARVAGVSVTVGVGLLAAGLAVQPPKFIQLVILFTGSGLASCFFGPVMLALNWRRATRLGTLAGMWGGLAVHLSIWLTGFLGRGTSEKLQPMMLLGLDPAMWGMMASLGLTLVVSRSTEPPSEELLARVFPVEVAEGARE